MSWWEPFALDDGEGRFLRLGPLRLWIERRDADWRFAWTADEDLFADTVKLSGWGDGASDDAPNPPEDARWTRVVTASDGSALRLAPRLPDRPTVVRPRDAIVVPPANTITLFVSLPLWIAIYEEGAEQPLLEVPAYRPSDTWFGSMTSGRLCYSLRTRGTRRLDLLPHLPHRAVTPLAIANMGQDALRFDRVLIPCGRLDVFRGASMLWTQAVTLERSTAGEDAEVRIEDSPPPHAVYAQKVASARAPYEGRFVDRVFASLRRGLGE